MTTVPAGDAELIAELKAAFERTNLGIYKRAADRLAAANAQADSLTGELEAAHLARAAAEARLAEVTAERDDARKSNREARRLIQSTHKRAITHTNCERQSCPICDGGLFMCADCGAAEIEAEERICTAAEARIASLTEALIDARKMIQTRETVDELGWGKGTSPATRLLAKIDAALNPGMAPE